jgi:hypothetical protein
MALFAMQQAKAGPAGLLHKLLFMLEQPLPFCRKR